MSTEIKALMDASSATPEVKLQTLLLGMQIADSQIKGQAGGEFLKMLLELLKLLLPLLLDLLKPKV